LNVIDTHILVWYFENPRRLGKAARRTIERLDARGSLAISSVSFFEIALLSQRRRAALASPVSELRADYLSRGGKEIPLDGTVAIRAGELQLLSDPFDRFIVATAELRGERLITADERILDWPGQLKRLDART
jgi:PIN domain nuclease of toxin-antitoxin system